MRRRTSASCALVISGEISSAKLAIKRSVSSARTSGGKATASRKISSDVAIVKDYSLLAVCDKWNRVSECISHAGLGCGNPTPRERWTGQDQHQAPRHVPALPKRLHLRLIKHPEASRGDLLPELRVPAQISPAQVSLLQRWYS